MLSCYCFSAQLLIVVIIYAAMTESVQETRVIFLITQVKRIDSGGIPFNPKRFTLGASFPAQAAHSAETDYDVHAFPRETVPAWWVSL